MLVCNVSQRPRRSAIAADVAEITAAVDALATGNVVFATLVDDPASVGETIDAYLGEIMLEAASADAVADAGLAFIGVIDEGVTAAETQDAAYIYSVNEVTTATDTPDGTVTSAPTFVTWEPGTVTAVTLSGGDLVATNTGTTSANQGARVATTAGKTSGKYYFEIVWIPTNGANFGVGVGTTASTYTNMGNTGTTGVNAYRTGTVWSNGSQVLNWGSQWASGSLIRIAIDLDNRKFWQAGTTGNWNNSGTANPATNTGGLTIPAGTMVPFVTFGGTSGVANNVLTANFGASAFTGAVPSTFTSGWPV